MKNMPDIKDSQKRFSRFKEIESRYKVDRKPELMLINVRLSLNLIIIFTKNLCIACPKPEYSHQDCFTDIEQKFSVFFYI